MPNLSLNGFLIHNRISFRNLSIPYIPIELFRPEEMGLVIETLHLCASKIISLNQAPKKLTPGFTLEDIQQSVLRFFQNNVYPLLEKAQGAYQQKIKLFGEGVFNEIPLLIASRREKVALRALIYSRDVYQRLGRCWQFSNELKDLCILVAKKDRSYSDILAFMRKIWRLEDRIQADFFALAKPLFMRDRVLSLYFNQQFRSELQHLFRLMAKKDRSHSDFLAFGEEISQLDYQAQAEFFALAKPLLILDRMLVLYFDVSLRHHNLMPRPWGTRIVTGHDFTLFAPVSEAREQAQVREEKELMGFAAASGI